MYRNKKGMYYNDERYYLHAMKLTKFVASNGRRIERHYTQDIQTRELQERKRKFYYKSKIKDINYTYSGSEQPSLSGAQYASDLTIRNYLRGKLKRLKK